MDLIFTFLIKITFGISFILVFISFSFKFIQKLKFIDKIKYYVSVLFLIPRPNLRIVSYTYD